MWHISCAMSYAPKRSPVLKYENGVKNASTFLHFLNKSLHIPIIWLMFEHVRHCPKPLECPSGLNSWSTHYLNKRYTWPMTISMTMSSDMIKTATMWPLVVDKFLNCWRIKAIYTGCPRILWPLRIFFLFLCSPDT